MDIIDVDLQLLPNFPRDAVPTDSNLFEPAHEGDAGVDLVAAESVYIPPGGRALIPTGIAIALPRGVEAHVRPRSGNAIRTGLQVHFGTIDSDYRGEIGVIVYNTNPVIPTSYVDDVFRAIRGAGVPATVRSVQSLLDNHIKANTINIRPGDKIAQLVMAEYKKGYFHLVDNLDETERGIDGYGSTGTISNVEEQDEDD